MRTALALVMLLGCVLLTGCGSTPPAPAAAPPAPSRLLDPAAFAVAVDAPGVTTIDVHVPFEGTVPGTDLDIPFDRIGAETARLPADRRAPLALYCRTGPMSAEASRTLADRGYTNIVELAGGMVAWSGSGRPLLDRPAPA